MKLQSRRYATTHGCTDPSAAHAVVRAVTAPLDVLYERKTICGYQLFVLATEDDYEEYDVDRELIEGATHGVLPAIFLNISYDVGDRPADVSAAEPVIAQYAFHHLLTYPADPSAA